LITHKNQVGQSFKKSSNWFSKLSQLIFPKIESIDGSLKKSSQSISKQIESIDFSKNGVYQFHKKSSQSMSQENEVN